MDVLHKQYQKEMGHLYAQYQQKRQALEAVGQARILLHITDRLCYSTKLSHMTSCMANAKLVLMFRQVVVWPVRHMLPC